MILKHMCAASDAGPWFWHCMRENRHVMIPALIYG